MQADEANQQRRNHKYVQREEARQSFAGDDRSAENQIDDFKADNRSAASNRRADAETPVCVLIRSEEHTSELQSHLNLVCRLLLEKKKKQKEFTSSLRT